MNHLNLSHRGKLAFAVLPLAAALLSPSAYAGTVIMDFDSVQPIYPGGGIIMITGAPVANYLASYGVSVSNATPGSSLSIADYSATATIIPSGNNVFSVGAPTPWGGSFTLNFSGPISDFSFTRLGYRGWPYQENGNILGDWSAIAYNASHVALGSIGEPIIATYAAIPMQTFTLGYQGISSITFNANAHGYAGVQMPWMDNMTFTTAVPEPETYAMLLAGLGLLGFTARRKKNPAA